VELSEAIRQRRMQRSFSDAAVDKAVLESLLDTALRAPSAGFSQGVDLLVLEDAASRVRFWSCASDLAWRAGARARALLAAPVVVVPVADPEAYVARYAAPDKASSDLAGRPADRWDVPYWTVDASFVVMQLLLAVTDANLGALFFRIHGDPDALLDAFGVPRGRLVVGAVAIGHPDDTAGSRPQRRRRRPSGDAVHRDRW